MEIEIFEKVIYLYKNAFNADSFIELVENECSEAWGYLNWSKTTTGKNAVTEYRSALGCDLNPLSINPISVERLIPVAEKWKQINDSIQACLSDYINMFDLGLSTDEGWRLLKYGASAEYRGHVDHASNNARVMSAVAFVNDGYTGGELRFPYYDISIKPEKGSVLLFPSNFLYYHIADPVGVNDDSVKYSIVSWLR